ncbi:MAG: methyltransferase domain-containing protein [Bacteroidota bacterium]
MDKATIDYYNFNAHQIAEFYLSTTGGISEYFSYLIKGTVLDVGCGSGRDMVILQKNGFDVFGIDASKGLIDFALSKHPQFNSRINFDSLPELKTINQKFNSIICSAVLMHLSNEEIFNSLFRFREILHENGKLLISIPVFENHSKNDQDSRFYNFVHPEKLILLCERIGFKLMYRWTNNDSAGRTDRKWITLLFSLESDSGIKPISIVESIINKDKKVATYKLALIRAFSDIATNNYNSAQWYNNKMVGIPVDLIAEKWIYYYWPIFESSVFIPQIQRETPSYSKPVAFRKTMDSIIDYYKNNNGSLPVFISDLKNNSFPNEIKLLFSLLIKIIKRTIIDGPVKHSGGINNENEIFRYDSINKCILMNTSLWKEFVLMGSWIFDAALLRWAELTKHLSQNQISSGTIIDLLTLQTIQERDVYLARSIFKNINDLECVWTGKKLNNTFDIDHVIPYSLWYNNDLWNLLPANSTINNQKSDKLPERNLILKRKEIIIHYWQISNNSFPERFKNETHKFTGSSITSNWENQLFHSFSEAIEFTSIKRGVNRWKPAY